MNRKGYKATNYLIQDAATRRMWEEGICACYPLRPVPPHPGPRPPWYKWRQRRRWQEITDARRNAKAWNFGTLYGANVSTIQVDESVVIIEDNFPWTQDAWDQMFPPGRRV